MAKPEEVIDALAADVKETIAAKFDELAVWKAKADRTVDEVGKVSEEQKNAIASLSSEIAGLNAKMNDILQASARKGAQAPARQSVGAQVVNSAVMQAHAGKSFKGQSEEIPVILALTRDTGGVGVVEPYRVPDFKGPGQEIFGVRNLLAMGQTDSNLVEYVVETGFTNNAAPTAEGAKKPESTLAFQKQSAKVQTIAHYLQVSKQMLADAPALQSYIDNRLVYGLLDKEESQIVSGDGTGENLRGLITAATAYDASGDQSTDTLMDKLANAILQVRLAHMTANGIIMHPSDVNALRKIKDDEGRYLFADPGSANIIAPWGVPIVESMNITAGHFCVGAFNQAAQLFDRQSATVDLSEHNEDNFVKNMVTIRVEERLALAIYRPEAIIYGAV